MQKSLQLIFVIVLGLCLVSCGQPEEIPANTIEPSKTPRPSETPSPFETPTHIPEPTVTPIAITSVEDLVGSWSRGELRQLFLEDGTFVSSEKGAWQCRGHFWFEGDQLYIEDLTPHCSIREVGIYEVMGVPQEYLKISCISDYSSSRKAHIRGGWQWANPP